MAKFDRLLKVENTKKIALLYRNLMAECYIKSQSRFLRALLAS